MHIYWWTHYGTFPPADGRELYPQRRAVLLHYLRNKGWTYEQLAQKLAYKKRFVYYMLGEKRIRMNSMAFLRSLAALLEIPPVLFGLDSQYVNAPTEPAWWIVAGYPPFPPGDDGYPHVGKVIAYYRKLRVQTLPDGSTRPWTQADLSFALDGTPKAMIRKYERGEAIDSQERRRALMHILGIPAVLLGLDGLQHLSPTDLVGPSLQLSQNFKPDSALLTRYEEAQGIFWQQYFTQHGQNLIPEAKQWITHLEEITPLITSTKDYCRAITIQAKYHQFLVNVGRQQISYPTVFAHANRSIELAESIQAQELLAVSLMRRASAYYEAGDFKQAQEDIESALALAKSAGLNVQGPLKANAARIYARVAESDIMRLQARHFLDQAHNILQVGDLSIDPYFTRFGHDIKSLRAVDTLLTLHTSRQPTLEDALYEIALAERKTSETMKRRHLMIEIFYAQAHLMQKEYAEATEKLFTALTISEEIKSYRGKQVIAELCQKLATTSYGGSPQVARLKWKLQQWGKASV